MAPPRVLVIYNEPVLPADHPDAAQEHDVIEASGLIVKILEEAGLPTRSLGFSHDPRPLIDGLRGDPPDVVFNMFEGLATQTGTEISVAGLLEWLKIPFTGSPSSAIALGRDKVRTKFLLQGAGLATARFQIIEQLPVAVWLYSWPAIVKPAYQDCSIGIEQASVVSTPPELERRVANILDRYGPPALVEEFISGREFHANIVEQRDGTLISIPLAEIRFAPKPGQRLWPIYSYDAKWKVETDEFQSTPFDTAVVVDPEIAERIRIAAEKAYKLVGLRDYGRIDLRLSEDGQPFILEVNPNPYIHSEAIIDGLKVLGRTHPEFIVEMVKAAQARGG